MDMNLREAVLAYMTVLGVREFQDKLSTEEQKIGTQNIAGCLHAIEERLIGQGDQDSLSLAHTIQERERMNGRIYDANDSELVESTRNCAQRVFNYYVERCR